MNNDLELNNAVEVTVSMEPVSKIDTSSVFDCQVDHTLVSECDCAICNNEIHKNDLFFPALPFITIKATLKRKIIKAAIEYSKEQRRLRKKKKSIAITARYGNLIDFKCGRFSHAFEKFKKNIERSNYLSKKLKNKNKKMAELKLKLLGM